MTIACSSSAFAFGGVAQDCCVLMATYNGETANNLDSCFAGIAAQTERPAKIVVVVDGPVDEGQETVIAQRSRLLPIEIVRLPKGMGLAHALNAGLPHCDRDWIMRVDSDDVSRPDRFEIQLGYARAHAEIDFVSAWVREVFADGAPAQVKISPTGHDDIVHALKWRNVVAHPAALMRAAAVGRIGGYRACFGMLEDYDLFVRLAQAGSRFHIVPKVLVDCGASAQQKERRGGVRYFRNELSFRFDLLRRDFITLRQFITTIMLYGVFRLVSGPIRRRLYALVRI